MEDCPICQRVLPPTELMQEIVAKRGLKFVVSEDEMQLLLVPLDES